MLMAIFGLYQILDQADLIQQVCRRSGVPRHSNAPERSLPWEDLA
jgi:hypothetical protein